jgi:hypothetical protein
VRVPVRLFFAQAAWLSTDSTRRSRRHEDHEEVGVSSRVASGFLQPNRRHFLLSRRPTTARRRCRSRRAGRAAGIARAAESKHRCEFSRCFDSTALVMPGTGRRPAPRPSETR